ncbi:hypothetical protein DOTSEDRAFT_30544 [Dothistroma septosporum NZE10]|uniref:F-box domain-containing protein n=1 Tax=Dothistroma septosporum (strain NZE10 / CBS 128990) TaxID=675120 RepID=N1Q435_DOTSN|nr:hypothetical protein DOTSEDRAFT_30544 [Dothistroma septosporum NZE10]
MLQVGNFDGWWKRAEMMLTPKVTSWTRFSARFSKRYIGLDVLGSIPAEAFDHIHALVPVLRKITGTPFRLLDLPAELRVRILETTFEKKQPGDLHAEAPKNGQVVGFMRRSPSRPAACRASRQLRVESIPIFLKGSEFRLVHNMEDRVAPGALRDWSLAHKQLLGSLRRLTVQFRPPMSRRQITVMRIAFVYSHGKGLHIDEREEMSEVSALSDVDNVVARLNAFGQTNGLEGALTTMYFTPPEMWSSCSPDEAQTEN